MFPIFKRALPRLRQFLVTESLLKMRKNAFYFVLKALFVLRIFEFLSWILVMYKNGLIRRIRLISKFMKQTIGIHILPNISRSKGNQTMKFGQLILFDMKDFSWKIIHKMWWTDYSQTFFWKIKIAHISELSQSFIQFVLIVCPSKGLSRYIVTKLQTTCFYLI